MRIFLPHFGQNMLFMDKVSNSETQMVTTDQSSELIPGDIILVEGKDFSNCLMEKLLTSMSTFM